MTTRSPAEERLKRLLQRPSVRTTTQVVARMRAIDEALPTADGVAWFNKLYLRTTENVLARITEGLFRNPEFMDRLDIVFANLYFRAVHESLHRPERIPKAWAPLFQDRSRRGVAPIQFALAGMNAHINRDLSVALVETCRRYRVRPDRTVKRDYDLINSLLQDTQDEIKEWFATGFLGVLDETFGEIDDVVANWSIGRAREAAWINGNLLFEIYSNTWLRRAFLANLDHTVGFAGRGLLVRTA